MPFEERRGSTYYGDFRPKMKRMCDRCGIWYPEVSGIPPALLHSNADCLLADIEKYQAYLAQIRGQK